MVSRWHKRLTKTTQSLLSVIIGFGWFLLIYLISLVYKESLCLFKRVFKIPCPGCGLTRGFFSILRLDFHEAADHNILSVPLFFSIAGYCFLCLADVIFDKKYIFILESYMAKKYMYPIYFLILIISYVINLQSN